MSKFNSENLYFDVNKFGGKVTIQKAYPELLAFKDISNIKTDEWKVGILLTDVGSPFAKIKDIKQKLDGVFNALSFDSTNKQSELYHDFLYQRKSGVIDACTFLIEYHNNHEFSAWWSLNKLYYELRKIIDRPISPDASEADYEKDLDRKTNLNGKADKMIADLKKYEVSLFGSTAMKADVAYKSKKQRIMNWNEKFADDNQVE